MRALPVLIASLLVLAGCAVLGGPAGGADESAVERRSYQTRAFDTADRQVMLQTIVATLQDLGYHVDQVNADIGFVAAARGSARRQTHITVTVNSRGGGQTLVRTTVHGGRGTSRDRQLYQRFFAALEKSAFLRANEAD